MARAENRQAVDGKEITEKKSKPRVRDKIFETARELFYQHGIHAVGVDMIVSEAGTNKMSFYRSFASKDELVAEYVRDQVRENWACWEATIAEHTGEPRLQMEALFDLLVKKVSNNECRGCALANVAVEIAEEEHPARLVIEQYKTELRRRFRKLARETGAHKADALGDALMLVWEGAYLTPLTCRGRRGPAHNAAKVARALMAAYIES